MTTATTTATAEFLERIVPGVEPGAAAWVEEVELRVDGVWVGNFPSLDAARAAYADIRPESGEEK